MPLQSLLSITTALGFAFSLSAQTPALSIADKVRSAAASYCADATFDVQLPQGNDGEVLYGVALTSESDSSDPLLGDRFIIDWTLSTPSGESNGFSAYFDGNLYRYRDNRLQEYHMQWDSIPFTAINPPIHRSSQFQNLLPSMLADEIRAMESDSTYTIRVYPDTIFNGIPADVIKGEQAINGYTARNIVYVFDAATGRPIFLEIESSPGTISEQIVSVRYDSAAFPSTPVASEEELIARYPDVFERFRESNFRLENLAGTPLPAIALPTTTSERYAHHHGEPFRAPTIFVVLDPAVASTPDMISSVRKASDSMPVAADIVWVFVTNNVDAVESLLGTVNPGEHALINGRSMVRDCGISQFPATIIVSADGNVSDVIMGYNKDITSLVIQKTAIAAI